MSFVREHRGTFFSLVRGVASGDTEVRHEVDRARDVTAGWVTDGFLELGAEDSPLLRVALRSWVNFAEEVLVELALGTEMPAVDIVSFLSRSAFGVVDSVGANAEQLPAPERPCTSTRKPPRGGAGWHNGEAPIAAPQRGPHETRFDSSSQKRRPVMGRLIYRDRASFDIDDRILAHLRIVVMNKLRRNEGFMLQLPVNEGVRQASLWIHASNALVMQFYGGREPAIDRALVDQMMHDASSADGLTLTAAGIAPATTSPPRQPVGGRSA